MLSSSNAVSFILACYQLTQRRVMQSKTDGNIKSGWQHAMQHQINYTLVP